MITGCPVEKGTMAMIVAVGSHGARSDDGWRVRITPVEQLVVSMNARTLSAVSGAPSTSRMPSARAVCASHQLAGEFHGSFGVGLSLPDPRDLLLVFRSSIQDA